MVRKTRHYKKTPLYLDAYVLQISTEAVENFKTVVGLTKEDVFYQKFNESLSKPYRYNLQYSINAEQMKEL